MNRTSQPPDPAPAITTATQAATSTRASRAQPRARATASRCAGPMCGSDHFFPRVSFIVRPPWSVAPSCASTAPTISINCPWRSTRM